MKIKQIVHSHFALNPGQQLKDMRVTYVHVRVHPPHTHTHNTSDSMCEKVWDV